MRTDNKFLNVKIFQAHPLACERSGYLYEMKQRNRREKSGTGTEFSVAHFQVGASCAGRSLHPISILLKLIAGPHFSFAPNFLFLPLTPCYLSDFLGVSFIGHARFSSWYDDFTVFEQAGGEIEEDPVDLEEDIALFAANF